jgi:uncharacterized protein
LEPLIESPIARSRAIGLDPRTLGITIFPTEKCNFRCVYCYEKFPNQRLTNALTSSILRLLSYRIPELHTLSIGWFGGEPLLELARVLQINRFAKNLCASGGCSFKSHMTTNGYLLDANAAKELVNVGVTSFQVSLDGTEEDHNRTRQLGSQEGTYATIIRNLVSLKHSPLEFEVFRLHVHAGNVESVRQLIDMLVKEFYGDQRFKLNLQGILKYDSSHKITLPLADRSQLRSLRDYAERTIPPSQLIRLSHLLSCCYASMPNHFVIRANGKVQKCTVALYDERNDVGELLHDGTFKWLEASRMNKWSAGLLMGDAEYMACPWKKIQNDNRPA